MTEELKQQEQNTENITDSSEKPSDELQETQEETTDSTQINSDEKNELSEENPPSSSAETTDSPSEESRCVVSFIPRTNKASGKRCPS